MAIVPTIILIGFNNGRIAIRPYAVGDGTPTLRLETNYTVEGAGGLPSAPTE